VTPSTKTESLYFWSVANGFSQDQPHVTQLLYDEIARAFDEDKQMVEAQQARLSEVGEAHLLDIGSDRARLQMRRAVQRLMAG
jgi:vanillate O-demethylase monooxygenase subunit